MTTIHLPNLEDVEDDVQLLEAFKAYRKAMATIARDLADAAGTVSGMLKPLDDSSQKRGRRKKVVRPIALSAGVLMLVNRYFALAARRYLVEYGEEIEAERRRRAGKPPARGRKFRVTGDAA